MLFLHRVGSARSPFPAIVCGGALAAGAVAALGLFAIAVATNRSARPVSYATVAADRSSYLF
jgi:hypothetical protein